MALNKWNTNFRLEHSVPCRLFPLHAPQDFLQERPKKSCFIYFPTGSYGFFLSMVNNRSNVWQLPCHVLFLTKGLFIRYSFFYPQYISHRAIFHLRSEKCLLFSHTERIYLARLRNFPNKSRVRILSTYSLCPRNKL